MNVLWTLLGVTTLVVVAYDLVATTIAPGSGAGPITRRLGRAVWWLGHLGAPGPTSWRLIALGPVVLLTTLTVWVVLTVVGWWASLSAVELVVASSRTPVDAVQRLAFTMTTVSTLGLGDVVPTTHPGRVLTGIASLTGIGIITLSVTYVLPVVTSVSDRRRQAMSIHALGSSTASLVESLDDPDVATPFLRQATTDVRLLAQRHLAYPVLHYFHGAYPHVAFAPNVAALDEAVMTLATRAEGQRPPRPVLLAFLDAVEDLLDVTHHHLRRHVNETDPSWHRDLAVDLHEALGWDESSVFRHRRRLDAFVADAGWSWSQDIEG